MAKTHWLGIAGSRELFAGAMTDTYWCLPVDASENDCILFYRPRAVGFEHHGIFAEGVVKSRPADVNAENTRCLQFGRLDHLGPLRHVAVTIERRFKPPLTTKEIKRDAVLHSEAFIRRNFQGTTFRLRSATYQRLVRLAQANVKLHDGAVDRRRLRESARTR